MPAGFRGAPATRYLTGVEASFDGALAVMQAACVASGVQPRQQVRLPYSAADGRFVWGTLGSGNMILCDETHFGTYAHHLRSFGNHIGGQLLALLAQGDDVATTALRLPDVSGSVLMVHEMLRGLATPISDLFCEMEAAVLRYLGQFLDLGGGGDEGVEFDAGLAEGCRDELDGALGSLATVMTDLADDIRVQAGLWEGEAVIQRGLALRTPSFGPDVTSAQLASDQAARTTATSEAARLEAAAGQLRGQAANLEIEASALSSARFTHNAEFDSLAADIVRIDRNMAEALDALTEEMDGHLRRLAEIRDAIDPATGAVNYATIARVAGDVDVGALLGDTIPVDLILAMYESGGHAAVRRLWDTLNESQRIYLVEQHSHVIDNLDGIPIGYRDLANLINIQLYLDGIPDMIAEIEEALRDLRGAPGHTQVSVDAQKADLWHRRRELEDMQEWLRQIIDNRIPHYVDGVRVYRARPVIFAFDPSQHIFITYHGPLNDYGDIHDSIVNIGVHVPGTGTTQHGFRGVDNTVYRLRAAAQAMGAEDNHSAMFAFGGGRFPQHVHAVHPGHSRDMGVDLAGFVNMLRSGRQNARFVVTGHSYGGATVGRALLEGMHADVVLFISAAGMGRDVTSLDDFPASAANTQFFSITPTRDFIRLAQGTNVGPWGHGASPYSDPRVTPLQSGWLNTERRDATVDGNFHYGRAAGGAMAGAALGPVGAVAGWFLGGESGRAVSSHSDVLEPESTDFNSIAAVIAGEPVLARGEGIVPDYGERPSAPECRPYGVYVGTR